MRWNALFILVQSERYVEKWLVSEFMLNFLYFQILIQFRTYINCETNVCRIYRDKYLRVRKISTRYTQKIIWELILLDAARLPCINHLWPQSRILHPYLSPPRTALARLVWASPAPGPTTQAGTSFLQALHHQPWPTSSWSFPSGHKNTTCPIILTQARWVAHWSASSCTYTIVCYFCK